MPWLAALVCYSAFDLAAHDAFGWLVGRPWYETLGRKDLKRDLADLVEDIPRSGQIPADFLADPARDQMPPGIWWADWIHWSNQKCTDPAV